MDYPLNRSLLHLLHRASQAANDLFASEIGNLDLTARQFVVLQAIAQDEGASQTALVEQTGVDRSTLADVVRRLQSKGLLSRRRTKEDARAYAVRLTEGGRKKLEQARAAAARVDKQLHAAMPGQKAGELTDALRILATHAAASGGQDAPASRRP